MYNTEKFLINGGRPLNGDVYISGGKNTAVAVIPAAILSEEECIIENVPRIDDVFSLIEILNYIGADVSFISNNSLKINPKKINKTSIPSNLSSKLRASYYLLGALLGKFKEVSLSQIGGCAIGARPIDQHIKGFKSLNINVDDNEEELHLYTNNIYGNQIFFDCISVGATINIILTAVKAEGNTTIYNAAREPHIVDLANFLNSMGASIKGAGTNTIRIKGVKSLHGTTYSIIPDQIETGTMMIAAAATHGDIIIHGCIPKHMESLSSKLLEIGIRVSEFDDCIRVEPLAKYRAVDLLTQAYPGFPTDLQQPMTALLTQCAGTSIVHENIYESRFNHIYGLRSMGSNIVQMDRTLKITGVPELHGAHVIASDLRAGAALVIAGLMAQGITEISNIHYIDRGYDNLENKLKQLGANIQRIKM